MALAKCVITETNGTTVHEYVPLNATVRFEGNKKPDTLDAIFPMQNKVKENYEITYIQDVVDVTYLRAVYPMQLSCLDESGYDQDPTDPAESRFVNITTNKFKGHYALDFNATSQNINVTTVDKIDLTKQFDIHIWFTPDATQFISGNSEPLLWSFYDGSNGLEIGISNQHDSIWRAFVRVDGSGAVNGYRGSTETVINGTDQPTHIRVKRGQDNVLKVYVNGILEALENVVGETPWDGVISSSLQPTGVDMVFGNGRGTNDHYKGYIHEIKVYCGTDLDEFQAEKIRWVKPIVQYMKFAGRVVKIKSIQTTNKVQCQSLSFRFTKGKLGQTGTSLDFRDLDGHTLDYTGGTGTMVVGSTIQGATSSVTAEIEQIIGTQTTGTLMLRAVSGNFTGGGETINETNNGSDWSASYTASTQTQDNQFKLILQSAVDEIDSTFTIRHLDSFAETTQISFILAGDIFEIGSFINFANILLLYSDTIMYMTPRKNIIIEAKSGKDTDYVFDQNGTNVKYNVKNSEDNDFKLINEVILTGRSPATNQRSNFTPTSGIIRSLRRNILQIDNSNDLKELADRTRIDLQGDITNDLAPKKYRIQINVPIPHVRYNMNVQIKRLNGANTLVGSIPADDLNEQAVIRQIEIYYPNGSTVIKVGENDIDYFDDVVRSISSEEALLDNTL